mmetsp:Transcript_42414/g.128186  ORF Transcript_42414/g.128186 Transcript_42414/m.128186 type:complete len:230 (+) Transcript_42414:2091-2780(+)
MRSPSVSASTEHSKPVSRRSKTISSPDATNPRTARLASSLLSGTTTPLPLPFPANRPFAFTTTSKGAASMYSEALSRSAEPLKVLYSATGIEWRCMNSLAKVLEDSNSAAFFEGPKTAMPCSRSTSTRPSTSICSGPTTTRLMLSSWQKATTSSKCGALTSRAWRTRGAVPESASSTSQPMPPFPGATKTQLTSNDLLSDQASACSRPPEPKTKTGLRNFAAERAESTP